MASSAAEMSSPANAPPQQPSSSDAYLLAFKQIDPVKDISNLPKMPCARQSLLLGIGGGVGVGAIRFLSSRYVRSSSNWAVATFGVLTLTSWEVCRRSHAKERAKMHAVMEGYRAKAKAKQPDGASNATIHAPAIGGVLIGEKGKEMLGEPGNSRMQNSNSQQRLV